MRGIKDLVVLGLIGVLLLSGCSMAYNTEVNADGSGEFGLSLVYTEMEARELAEMADMPVDGLCQALSFESDLPANATIREEQRGNETWCTIAMPFADLDELDRWYSDVGVEVNRLEIIDDRFYFDADVDMSGADEIGFMFEAVFTLTLPGSAGANNATRQEGRTLIWELDTTRGNNLYAESALGTFPWVYWLLGIMACLCLLVVVLGAGVGVFFYLRNKNKQQEAKKEA
ncbi:MAG: hypothetical protein JXB85_11550 [Anaerolineales bacterium]|nr:hypothetical protein [Anaerolineales bacterium]